MKTSWKADTWKGSRNNIRMGLREMISRIPIELNGLEDMYNGNLHYRQSAGFRLYHNLVRTPDNIEHSGRSHAMAI
jgi:hypothetical protein